MLTMTERQGFDAMVLFLKEWYRQTKYDQIGIVLGELKMLPDGRTSDPAAWSDWMRAVNRALSDDPPG
jgi:hypothetical protein